MYGPEVNIIIAPRGIAFVVVIQLMLVRSLRH